jgi:hypothetical protein
LIAAIELGRRVYYEKKLEYIKINNSKDIYIYFNSLFKDVKQEHFYVLYLDTNLFKLIDPRLQQPPFGRFCSLQFLLIIPLIPLESITGPQGKKGDKGENGSNGINGKEIELRKSETTIQWRYVGTEEWTDLITLESITGPQGKPGINGTDGKDGINGKSAYEIAKEKGFDGTETEWL